MRITTKTKLTSVEVIKRAIKFFGPDGYKLVLTGQTETSVAFEGGGGSVSITLVMTMARLRWIFSHVNGIIRLRSLSG